MNHAIKCFVFTTAFLSPGISNAIDLAPIKQLLKDPYSAKFTSVSERDDGTVCGLVNAKNSYGAYVGRQPFAINTNGVAYLVDQNNGDQFDFDCLGGKERLALNKESEAQAQNIRCPDDGEMVFSCSTSKGKELLLCRIPGGVFYSFGPKGRPELTLSRLTRDVSFSSETIGGKFSQKTILTNGNYKYEIFGGYTQGVNVSKDGNSLGFINCNHQSTYDRMEILSRQY